MPQPNLPRTARNAPASWVLAALLVATPAAAQDALWTANRSVPATPSADVVASGTLVANPNRVAGAPPYAIADRDGKIVRLVEPNGGVDLPAMVGQRVRIRHDTGKTLLATQLTAPDPQPLQQSLPMQRADDLVRLAQGYAYVDTGMDCPPIMMEPCGPACPTCPPPCAPVCVPVSPPPPGRCELCTPRSFVFGEYLHLRGIDGDVTHAQQQNGIGGAGTVPFGQIGTVDTDYSSGYRVGGGLWLDECSGLAVSYTRFQVDGTDTVTPPNITGGGGAVGSLVLHPGAALTASVGPVTANYDISFRLADVMYRDAITCSRYVELNYALGAVFAQLDQTFSQTGVFGGGAGGQIDTRANVDFEGAGLKAGLDGRRRLAGGFSVYGRTSASAMTGRVNADFTQTNATTTALLANSVWEDNRFASILEYELGLAWSTPKERFMVSAGYLFQRWGGVLPTDEWIRGVQSNSYVDLDNSLGFDGLTARAEARW
ncbi:hypothetical protein Pla175_05800 [Pirellulimonas nuda]|uniref:Outer membrane protein beta-barrel domain-containing protein n=1 Tax=Pirellulimonas nuda TaxID=2528009 RepID=A0A518D6W5_9BACT|nr:Lpg1974 family pore-forming outer membrane protein [Pirellulimonas nuda]QDU87223.1 hypothetical protein Pla175_05800 [Pirellulimonas nuda]